MLMRSRRSAGCAPAASLRSIGTGRELVIPTMRDPFLGASFTLDLLTDVSGESWLGQRFALQQDACATTIATLHRTAGPNSIAGTGGCAPHIFPVTTPTDEVCHAGDL